MGLAFTKTVDQGLHVRVRLQPSARHDGVDGVIQDADGLAVLKASVTQAPEDGKANKALIKMLAKNWKLAKSSIEVVQGLTRRNKVLLVWGDAAELERTLTAWAVKNALV